MSECEGMFSVGGAACLASTPFRNKLRLAGLLSKAEAHEMATWFRLPLVERVVASHKIERPVF